MYASFVLLAVCWLADSWVSGQRGSALEKPIKIALALPCLLYLVRRPPRSVWLWHGLVVGAIGAATIALYQVTKQMETIPAGGWFRAHGFTHPIQFGNIAILLGTLSLCSWNRNTSQPILWRFWLTSGFAAGLVASLLSSSRGGWLSLILIGIGASIYSAIKGYWRIIIPITLIGLIVAGAATQIPQLRILERIGQAGSEVNAFRQQGDATSSVGARLQMWDFAWELYKQKPLLGWSQRGYDKQKQILIESKKLDPILGELNHPHNELLDTASKRGTVGIAILLLVYISPTILFIRKMRITSDPNLRSAYLAGSLIPIVYFGFGLTQSFLPHTSGITIYIYLLCLIWAVKS